MKSKFLLLSLAIIALLFSCTTLQQPAEIVAAEYLENNSLMYITVKPDEFADGGMENLISFIMPTLTKDQKEAIKRIDLIIAGISLTNNKPTVDAIIQGDFPSLNLLINLDSNKNWNKKKNVWCNSQYNVSILEAAPGTFYVKYGNLTEHKALSKEEKKSFIDFINYMTRTSLTVGIYSLETFSQTVLKSDSENIPIHSIFTSFNKVNANNTYDFSITLTFPDIQSATENMLFARTVVIIAMTAIFQGVAGSKIIQKLEWNTDDAGRVTALYRGLSLLEVQTLLSSTSSININELLRE